MDVKDGRLLLPVSSVSLVEEWFESRRRLYRYLLLNPDEFAAKCMLEEAALSATSLSDVEFRWQDVDFQLVETLEHSTVQAKNAVMRLMLGDVYGCGGLFSTSSMAIKAVLRDRQHREEVEAELARTVSKLDPGLRSASVAVHVVEDRAHSERRVVFETSEAGRMSVGRDSKRSLLGVFFRNPALSASRMGRMRDDLAGAIARTLGRQFRIPQIRCLRPYSESLQGDDVY
jgi:hypothetical protein